MRTLPCLTAAAATLIATFSTAVQAEDVRVVSWNMAPGLFEAVLGRRDDIRALDAALQPDIIVLIEVAGINEVRELAKALGWPVWHAAVSDGMKLTTQTSTAIETAVISKLPITSVLEYDTKPDTTHPVITNAQPDGDSTIPVSEKLLDSRGISGVDPTAGTDRGTMRVDLQGGLSIFPVHLKSNLNGICLDADNAGKILERFGLQAPPELAQIVANGNASKANEDALNAKKRERIIAAIKQAADSAVADGRDVILAGDYNTSFEDGKAGTAFADCQLQPFSCEKAPFPAAMCQGDGFDDTFAILQRPLVGTTAWTVLTKDLGRTYDDAAFADKAIDHFAVPTLQASRFEQVKKGEEVFGSDHFPITLVYKAP